ncbi:MAG TPA: FecR domain-containing protein [Gemmatimonadaceae bacterium]|nr:FecR domain-containing protein [Gemmatimonadaceae bacterium]
MTDHLSDFDNADSSHSPEWEAIARHVAGESTAESAAQVDALLSDGPERDLVASLQGITNGMSAGIPTDIDVESALKSVKARMNEGVRPSLKVESGRGVRTPAPVTRWRVPFPAIAAAGLLVAGLGTWLTLGKRTEPTIAAPPKMVATGVGVRDSLRLADGTKVVLGPLSSVKVVAGYGSGSREVEIRGDAYFEVVHDSSKPFTVYVGNATVRDVGTKFAVSSNDSGDIGVSVTEGAVSLAQGRSPKPEAILKAGDQGTVERSGKVVTHRGAASDDDIAWLNGRLVFREAPISEVASSVRRWYGIDLQIADPSLANRHITATFSGEPPERVLEVLRLALGADIERHGDTAVVRSAKGRAR